jgi:hypothetical protein
MSTLKLILGLAIVGLILYSCWQVIPPELANYEFQQDLHDLAMQVGSQQNRTDDDLRNAVLSKAQSHDIQLQDNQIIVQHIGTPGMLGMYFAADYTVPVTLPGYSLTLHFTPSSGNKPL